MLNFDSIRSWVYPAVASCARSLHSPARGEDRACYHRFVMIYAERTIIDYPWAPQRFAEVAKKSMAPVNVAWILSKRILKAYFLLFARTPFGNLDDVIPVGWNVDTQRSLSPLSSCTIELRRCFLVA